MGVECICKQTKQNTIKVIEFLFKNLLIYKLFLWWQLVITIAYIANAHAINNSEFYHFKTNVYNTSGFHRKHQ